MSNKLTFTIQGTAGDGQTWTTSGPIAADLTGFAEVCHAALLASFAQLTSGKAVFGKPGVGCRGPYEITRFLVERSARRGLSTIASSLTDRNYLPWVSLRCAFAIRC